MNMTDFTAMSHSTSGCGITREVVKQYKYKCKVIP